MSYDTERDLIIAAKVNPEAFGELYTKYVDRIYNYHYRHTSNRTEAEDLASRTFYRETGAPFQAWLFRIAHNLVVNWYRDHQSRPTVSIDVEDAPLLVSSIVSPETWVSTAETRQKLLEVIESLPEDRKTLIILKFVDHMSNAEIAEVLGRTEGAIKALYHRTLISLKRAMSEGAEDAK